jgi:hypothetical protein
MRWFLRLFSRKAQILLDIPAETFAVIERAAFLSGRSVETFIIEAAIRRAREIVGGGEAEGVPANTAYPLSSLMKQITPENRHDEQ